MQLALGAGGQQVQDGGACRAAALHLLLVPKGFTVETALWVRLQLQLLDHVLHRHLGRTTGARGGGTEEAAAAAAASLQ